MDLLTTLVGEFVGFFRITPFLDTIQSGNLSVFLTKEGLHYLLNPLLPCMLFIELVICSMKGTVAWSVYRVNLLTYIANRILGRYVSFYVIVLVTESIRQYAIIETQFTWYWFIYGYLVWELAHFVYHYLGHKIRLLWCLHSTHHVPEEMNLSVSYAHFFFENAYATLVRSGICFFLGVDPVLLLIIMVIDETYSSFIHTGHTLIKEGRMGFLEKFILTPSHHRVHHARNPIYIDTNFCNLINVWDRLFGTYRELDSGVPPDYGITRDVNSASFFDAYFGEFVLLARDVAQAPGLANKLKYMIMPPGWSHDSTTSEADSDKDTDGGLAEA